ncbi:hypothetical protein ACQKWADRAFT_307775 [Trichoderma austrokoningii]
MTSTMADTTNTVIRQESISFLEDKIVSSLFPIITAETTLKWQPLEKSGKFEQLQDKSILTLIWTHLNKKCIGFSVLRMRSSIRPILQSGILIPLMESDGCSIVDGDEKTLSELEFGKKICLPAQVDLHKLNLKVEQGAVLCFLWVIRTEADRSIEGAAKKEV